MPSHISHALLAEAVAADLIAAGWELFRDPDLLPLLITGAQGPDLFLHNHRRKPRGFRYGALLHRKGNSTLLSALAVGAHDADCAPELAAFAAGYITHVWFDRGAHPYINWSAGWRGTPDHHPDRPAMHAFLERLIDVQLLRLRTSQSVAEYGFAAKLPRRADLFFLMRPVLATALQHGLVSARDDAQLPRRLLNALHDSISFYRFTDSPDRRYFQAARAAERAGRASSRWLSVVHPPEELISVDALNTAGRVWRHPCDPRRESTDSIPDLFETARRRSVESFVRWHAVMTSPTDAARASLEDHIGPWNLNDGIAEDPPCRRTLCDPLPLLELYQEIKSRFER